MTDRQKVGLRRIKRRKGIVIKPADKGSGICVLSIEQYIKEAERQLSNSSLYSRIDTDISPHIASNV